MKPITVLILIELNPFYKKIKADYFQNNFAYKEYAPIFASRF